VKRKALLVFADPTGLDLARRRFPKTFRSLFEIRSIGAAQLDADVHLFTSAYSPGTPDIEVHRQVGSTFAERLDLKIQIRRVTSRNQQSAPTRQLRLSVATTPRVIEQRERAQRNAERVQCGD
jgi:hypothetical protein